MADSDVDAVDRIGDLPDGILIDIISHLATDEMARTSVLSSRWRRLWLASPVLHFTRASSSVFADPDHFPAIVDHCLRQRPHGSTLRSARFPLTNDADRWIRFSAASGVEDLALTPTVLGRHRVEVPASLFDCRLLSALRLSSASIHTTVPSAGFPFLRTLAFTHLIIQDAAMAALLSACPRIEHLSLTSIVKITSLVVRAPAMRHLMVFNCQRLKRVELVDVPELWRLMYDGDLSILNLEGAGGKLQEASLLSSGCCEFTDIEFWRKLVTIISNVRVLNVNSWLFEFAAFHHYAFGVRHQMFENLKELHWWPVLNDSVGEPWQVEIFSDALRPLVLFLRDCPSLEHLCILCAYDLEQDMFRDFVEMFAGDGDDNDDEDPLQEFEGVGYELPRLKSFRLAQFSDKKAEMRLLKFLGDKALVLESMNLHYVGKLRRSLNKIRKKLRAIRRISPAARILISEFDEDNVCSKHEKMWYEFTVIGTFV